MRCDGASLDVDRRLGASPGEAHGDRQDAVEQQVQAAGKPLDDRVAQPLRHRSSVSVLGVARLHVGVDEILTGRGDGNFSACGDRAVLDADVGVVAVEREDLPTGLVVVLQDAEGNVAPRQRGVRERDAEGVRARVRQVISVRRRDRDITGIPPRRGSGVQLFGDRDRAVLVIVRDLDVPAVGVHALQRQRGTGNGHPNTARAHEQRLNTVLEGVEVRSVVPLCDPVAHLPRARRATEVTEGDLVPAGDSVELDQVEVEIGPRRHRNEGPDVLGARDARSAADLESSPGDLLGAPHIVEESLDIDSEKILQNRPGVAQRRRHAVDLDVEKGQQRLDGGLDLNRVARRVGPGRPLGERLATHPVEVHQDQQTVGERLRLAVGVDVEVDPGERLRVEADERERQRLDAREGRIGAPRERQGDRHRGMPVGLAIVDTAERHLLRHRPVLGRESQRRGRHRDLARIARRQIDLNVRRRRARQRDRDARVATALECERSLGTIDPHAGSGKSFPHGLQVVHRGRLDIQILPPQDEMWRGVSGVQKADELRGQVGLAIDTRRGDQVQRRRAELIDIELPDAMRIDEIYLDIRVEIELVDRSRERVRAETPRGVERTRGAERTVRRKRQSQRSLGGLDERGEAQAIFRTCPEAQVELPGARKSDRTRIEHERLGGRADHRLVDDQRHLGRELTGDIYVVTKLGIARPDQGSGSARQLLKGIQERFGRREVLGGQAVKEPRERLARSGSFRRRVPHDGQLDTEMAVRVLEPFDQGRHAIQRRLDTIEHGRGDPIAGQQDPRLESIQLEIGSRVDGKASCQWRDNLNQRQDAVRKQRGTSALEVPAHFRPRPGRRQAASEESGAGVKPIAKETSSESRGAPPPLQPRRPGALHTIARSPMRGSKTPRRPGSGGSTPNSKTRPRTRSASWTDSGWRGSSV